MNGLVRGGAHSNRQFFFCKVGTPQNIDNVLLDIFYEPQTSGGLSLPSENAEKLVEALKKEGQNHTAIVGDVVGEHPGKIQLL